MDCFHLEKQSNELTAKTNYTEKYKWMFSIRYSFICMVNGTCQIISFEKWVFSACFMQ